MFDNQIHITVPPNNQITICICSYRNKAGATATHLPARHQGCPRWCTPQLYRETQEVCTRNFGHLLHCYVLLFKPIMSTPDSSTMVYENEGGTPPRVISSNHPGLTWKLPIHLPGFVQKWGIHSIPWVPNEFSAHGSVFVSITTNGCASFFSQHVRRTTWLAWCTRKSPGDSQDHRFLCGSHHDRFDATDLARTVFTDQTKRDLNQEVSLGCTLETIITHRIHVCYIW